MKCELCHKNDAETALTVMRDGAEDELYVCKACAEAERVQRQKKRQRTSRRDEEGCPPEVEMTVTQIGGNGEEPPPIIQALLNAFDGFVTDVQAAAKGAKKGAQKGVDEKQVKMHVLSLKQVPTEYMVRGMLHLEGLSLLGEIEALDRALRALKMELVGRTIDRLNDCGRAYVIKYSGSSVQARRVLADIIEQEKNARQRLEKDLARVFVDTICRALATVKNCRLMTWGEFFDCLSPLRIAAMLGCLDGIDAERVTYIMEKMEFLPDEEQYSPEEYDRLRASCAEIVNRAFKDVILSEKGEELWK